MYIYIIMHPSSVCDAEIATADIEQRQLQSGFSRRLLSVSDTILSPPCISGTVRRKSNCLFVCYLLSYLAILNNSRFNTALNNAEKQWIA